MTESAAKLALPETDILSVRGRKWIVPDISAQKIEQICQTHNVPDIIARLLINRDVPFDDIPHFFDPTLRALLPNPSKFQDMDKGAARIAEAIQGKEKIAIFGDYDVDGATSSALWGRFLGQCGLTPTIYIPDRIDEGYGPNAPALCKLQDQGHSLIIMVDCGISAHEPLTVAADRGLDVVVIDHHMAEPKLPPAVALINPNRLDEDGFYGYLAACGVVYLTLIAVNRVLRDKGFYDNHPAPDLLALLDIVALGTVCDVVPLIGLNRAFVRQGLKIMERRQNPGITALCDLSKINGPPTPFHLGFVVGPRINAGGRVGQADLGARLLSTNSTSEARALAMRLDEHNQTRQAIEADVLATAKQQCAEMDSPDKKILFAHGENWHPGVIGIVASRLKDQFDKPVCVIAWMGDGTGKASGRSMNGFDLGAAIIATRQAGFFINGGGHKMAGGFTVDRHKIDDAITFMNDHLIKQERSITDTIPTTTLDAIVSPSGITTDLATIIDKVGPYGTSNREPIFGIFDCKVKKIDILKNTHLRCYISDSFAAGSLKTMAFRALETDWGQALVSAQQTGQPVHLAGTIGLNHWQGRVSADFTINDVVKA